MLNALRETIDIKVQRGGEQVLVSNHKIVVGDIVFLDTGDKVVADCILCTCQGLVLDESSLTGESDPVKKDCDNDPWILSGTKV
jgi:Ca2+-transporting ATPase